MVPRLPVRGIGRMIGLPKITVALSVGLEVIVSARGSMVGYELEIVGEEAAELTLELGMFIGSAIGCREPFPLPIGDPREGCESLSDK